MPDKVTPKYTCARGVLYPSLRMAWDNCSSNLTEFHAFSEKYDAAYIIARKAEIDATELLADQDVRTEPSELDRIDLISLGDVSLKKFRYLERYIIHAYVDKATQKTMLDAAGKSHYAEAFSHNWTEMLELNKAGDVFISDHSAALLAGTNMPSTFAAAFTLARTNFSDQQSLFKTDEGTQTPGQQAKIVAENNCYELVAKMLADGIVIFDLDAVMTPFFTWARIVLANSGPKPAGCKGNVTTGVAHKPVSGVTCYIEELDLTALTDAKGHFNFGTFAHGTYTITFTKTGYKPVSLVGEVINLHTTITRHIVLIPV